MGKKTKSASPKYLRIPGQGGEVVWSAKSKDGKHLTKYAMRRPGDERNEEDDSSGASMPPTKRKDERLRKAFSNAYFAYQDMLDEDVLAVQRFKYPLALVEVVKSQYGNNNLNVMYDIGCHFEPTLKIWYTLDNNATTLQNASLGCFSRAL
ncbi:hypothetical protein BJV82DRAFT_584097 [Fennellomyces sp. T-0311]|nr:hypothetical protein BJV82DRAFT_584097 [Fennellomyces sp. T-0311]